MESKYEKIIGIAVALLAGQVLLLAFGLAFLGAKVNGVTDAVDKLAKKPINVVVENKSADPKLGIADYNINSDGFTNSNKSIGVSSTRVVATSTDRVAFTAVNDSANDIYLCLADVCAANTGILLNSRGGTYDMDASNIYTGSISAVAGGASSNLAITYK